MAEQQSRTERRSVPATQAERTSLQREGHARDLHRRDRLRPHILVALLSILLAFLLMLAAPTVSSMPPSTYAPLPSTSFTEIRFPDQERSTPEITAMPVKSPKTDTTMISGVATWYCNRNASRGPLSRCPSGYSGGLYAAISPDLLYLRGKTVLVCATSCVRVKVVDCDCQAKRAIDLFADAFMVIAPLSAGRISVTISF